MRKGLTVAAVTLGMACAASAAESRREVTRLPNGNVDVLARNTPLGRLLKQFALLTRLDTSLIDRHVELLPVDMAVHDVPVDAALGAALRASGVSFVVWGEGTADMRIVAFPSGTAPEGPKAVSMAEAPPPMPAMTIDPNLDPAIAAALAAGIAPDDPDMAMIGSGAPERTIAPEDDPDLAEILGPPPEQQRKPEEGVRQP